MVVSLYLLKFAVVVVSLYLLKFGCLLKLNFSFNFNKYKLTTTTPFHVEVELKAAIEVSIHINEIKLMHSRLKHVQRHIQPTISSLNKKLLLQCFKS